MSTFTLRNDAPQAAFIPHLVRIGFKVGAEEAAALKTLAPKDAAFAKRIAAIDQHVEKAEKDAAEAQDRVRAGTASAADMELTASFDLEAVKDRFRKPKRLVTEEREEFLRHEVRPVLHRVAGQLCEAVNAERAAFEKKLRQLHADAGVPYPTDQPMMHSIDRFRDAACGALSCSWEYPAGTDQVRAVIGECSPI